MLQHATSIINDNFLHHSTWLQSQTRGMKVVHAPGLSWSDSGISCDTFNILYIKDASEFDVAAFHEATDHYNRKNFEFCVWINEENLSPAVINAFNKENLHEAGTEPGMLIDLKNFTAGTLQADVRRLNNPDALKEFAHVVSLNWDPPDHRVNEFYNKVAEVIFNGHHPIEYYGSYVDGKLVSVIELFPDTMENAGLYSLCTLSEYRGKGIATNLMKHCLTHLKNSGYSSATLQAADDGLNIYKKLGFIETTRFYEFKQTS
jgi:ribosomal protein S18 acetylase RimI-like enzyme